jgi:hypothetical protein
MALFVVVCTAAVMPAPTASATEATIFERAGASGPVGCLSPRAPVSTRVANWLPEKGGVIDYEPEDAGVIRKSSALALKVARNVQVATGHGFKISTVSEFHSPTCIVDWDFGMSRATGGFAYVRVLQLRSPLNEMSFPIVGQQQPREQLADGTEVLSSVEPDRSSVTVVSVRRDGLLVFMQVRSPSGPNTAGWPTTTTTSIPVPPSRAALSVSQATAATLSISNSVATSSR